LDGEAALLILECGNTIADMLATETHSIATAKTGVEQHVEPYPLPGAYGPACLIGFKVSLGPHLEAFGFLARRVRHASSRVSLDQTSLVRPSEGATHGVEEVPGLGRCGRSPLLTGSDGRGGDLGVRLLPGRLEHTNEDVVALSSCSG
jgi:hypothetical protein